jgi:hypothetical protein
MAKILFLVRSVSPFISNRRDVDFIITNLIGRGHQVDVYDPKQNKLIKVNKSSETSLKIFPNWCYIKKVSLLLNFIGLIFFCIQKKGKYDIVQINYLRTEYLIIPTLISKMGSRLFIFLYGSDVNKKSFTKKHFSKIFKYAHQVIVCNYKLINSIPKKNLLKHDILNKTKVLFLPMEHFSLYTIKEIQDKEESKKRLQLPEKKSIIIVGVSGIENEQHELIIEQLKKLENLENYFFIFPMSNRLGANSGRIKDIKNQIEQKLISDNTLVIPDYISFEKMAEFRMASDILLNFRKIDQLTAAMIESNLAFCQVITASWLPYEDYIKQMNISVVYTFEEINKTIVYISNDPQLNQKLIHNKKEAERKYKIDVINDWLMLYNE